jgi:hypothetical protein
MKPFIASLIFLSIASAGAAAQEQGAVTIGKQQGVKLAQAECQAAWAKANPGKKDKISAGQAIPFIADIKAANGNGDGFIDQAEFTAACEKGLMKDNTSASTGASSGTAGAAAPDAQTSAPSVQSPTAQ